MGKEGVLERDGEVLEVLPAGFFKVKLKDVDTLVRCKKSGRMSQSNISIIQGDRVKLEINQYDMGQGRIIFRYNDYKNLHINTPTTTINPGTQPIKK
ncbi:MAG: translation initiation factor IF-1 [candidate division SR1 bacterium]|nr:translation initiation factor IF-1 [candidate division SR1 bacterium]